MVIALITGASSGLGREYVRQLGRDPKIQEIWAVARRAGRLEQLQELVPCPVRPVPLDLTDPVCLDQLKALLEQTKPTIRHLVCAAGFGKIGDIAAMDLADSLGMIDLNCRGAVAEVCSTAAFQPLPGLGTYAATKAFLQSYAKTLHHELLPRGIHVTAVCPYWVKDTEFIPLAQGDGAGQFRHYPFASRSRSVVALSRAASALNLWVATPGIVCTVHRLGAKFIPHCLLVPLLGLLRRL